MTDEPCSVFLGAQSGGFSQPLSLRVLRVGSGDQDMARPMPYTLAGLPAIHHTPRKIIIGFTVFGTS